MVRPDRRVRGRDRVQVHRVDVVGDAPFQVRHGRVTAAAAVDQRPQPRGVGGAGGGHHHHLRAGPGGLGRADRLHQLGAAGRVVFPRLVAGSPGRTACECSASLVGGNGRSVDPLGKISRSVPLVNLRLDLPAQRGAGAGQLGDQLAPFLPGVLAVLRGVPDPAERPTEQAPLQRLGEQPRRLPGLPLDGDHGERPGADPAAVFVQQVATPAAARASAPGPAPSRTAAATRCGVGRRPGRRGGVPRRRGRRGQRRRHCGGDLGEQLLERVVERRPGGAGPGTRPGTRR